MHCVVEIVCVFSGSKALHKGNAATIANGGNCTNASSGFGLMGGLSRLECRASAEPLSIIMQWNMLLDRWLQMLKGPTNLPTTALSALNNNNNNNNNSSW